MKKIKASSTLHRTYPGRSDRKQLTNSIKARNAMKPRTANSLLSAILCSTWSLACHLQLGNLYQNMWEVMSQGVQNIWRVNHISLAI